MRTACIKLRRREQLHQKENVFLACLQPFCMSRDGLHVAIIGGLRELDARFAGYSAELARAFRISGRD
jgi:hypothetical protein